ncbi:MAG: flagellar biosynthesis protein FlhB [Fibromonadales bacterium]|nr:flagellar biosynthesis protein FlhB [Fibromonadales bacterium]MCL2207607.1 flagellar biosynthesis protein FlhB [Fibromonadales bacterium]
MADDEDKTEEPTSKKKSDAIKKGQIGRSMDLSSAIALIGALWGLYLFGGDFAASCKAIMHEFFIGFVDWQPTLANFSGLAYYVLNLLIKMLAPLLLLFLFLGLVGNLAQVGLHFTLEKLQPKLSNVFSLASFKRLFGKDAWVELLKGVAKITIVGIIAYFVIKSHYEDILYMADMEIGVFCAYMIDIIVELLLKVIIFLIILGIVDLIYQKRKTHNEMKMTKNEVKDEHKQSEGDPKVVAARKRMMYKLHQQFMMKEVPSATVVITNPTHLAIALRYERGKDQVPLVVAKGEDKIAERIKQLAVEHNVPIVENKPLARAMYYVVEVGDPLPAEFFSAVAEVLAYVFRQKEAG